jgi:hypothetical protein
MIISSSLVQIATYGVALLKQLPSSCRSSILVGVTNLQKITFMRVTRRGGQFHYALSEEMSEVLEAICAVMLTPLDEVC